MNKRYDAHKKQTLLFSALLVSIALNLFLGAWSGLEPGGRGGKHFGPMALSSPHGEFMEEKLTRYLTTADSAAFHAALQPELDALRQAHAHVHEATNDLAAAYEKEPADPAALQAALDRVKQAKNDVNDIVAKIVMSTDTTISADGRHRLAETSR